MCPGKIFCEFTRIVLHPLRFFQSVLSIGLLSCPLSFSRHSFVAIIGILWSPLWFWVQIDRVICTLVLYTNWTMWHQIRQWKASIENVHTRMCVGEETLKYQHKLHASATYFQSGGQRELRIVTFCISIRSSGYPSLRQCVALLVMHLYVPVFALWVEHL